MPAPAVQAFTIADQFLNSEGLLRVWPENVPVVQIWRLIPDQWIRAGMDAIPVAPDMGLILRYAEAWAREHGGPVLPLVDRLRVLADLMLEFIHEEAKR